MEIILNNNNFDTTTKLNNLKIIIKHNAINNLNKNNITIYTDGSKILDKTAYALVVKKDEQILYQESDRIRDKNTVYQAELFAIYRAIIYIKNQNVKNAIIFSDSQASVLTLQKLIPKTKLHDDIIQTLLEIPHSKITLKWIRGHIGIQGNEMADSLAKSATLNSTFITDIQIPISTLKYNLKTELMQTWQREWEGSQKGRFTFSLLPNVSQRNFLNETSLLYFLTGHGSFPSYLQKINKSPSDKCFCGAKGDPLHYVYNTCSLMPHSLKFNSNIPISENIKLLLKNKYLIKKLTQNYNVLNSFYSFINYKL